MYLQFTLDKIPNKMFLFTTTYFFLVIPFRRATNSTGPGARLSTIESAQHVDQI